MVLDWHAFFEPRGSTRWHGLVGLGADQALLLAW
jgi:hypothetical protein